MLTPCPAALPACSPTLSPPTPPQTTPATHLVAGGQRAQQRGAPRNHCGAQPRQQNEGRGVATLGGDEALRVVGVHIKGAEAVEGLEHGARLQAGNKQGSKRGRCEWVGAGGPSGPLPRGHNLGWVGCLVGKRSERIVDTREYAVNRCMVHAGQLHSCCCCYCCVGGASPAGGAAFPGSGVSRATGRRWVGSAAGQEQASQKRHANVACETADSGGQQHSVWPGRCRLSLAGSAVCSAAQHSAA